jgi:hypothetical protein
MDSLGGMASLDLPDEVQQQLFFQFDVAQVHAERLQLYYQVLF